MWGMRQQRMPEVFDTHFQCFSGAVAGKLGIDEGDKILLPPSALNTLARMDVDWPMLFEVMNESLGKRTHCGVLEFVAEEGRCYMPFWMMQNLVIEEGGLVKVKNVSLKKATFVKFKPLSVDFLEISNPKAVLETKLRKFTCLTVGDQICIQHSDKSYYLEIRDVQPNGAASIIETDCNVDFEEPVGYKESFEKKSNADGVAASGTNGTIAPTLPRTLQKAKAETDTTNVFKPFSGGGFRIDGREAKNNQAKAVEPEVPKPESINPEVPTYQSKIGNQFAKKKNSVSAFTGAGHKLT